MAEDTFDVALDASVSGGENATSGPNPLDWDAQAIAEGAAAAAGAAVCAAYGLAAAAPLCGVVAGEVAAFVIDNVIGPLAEFFSGIFTAAPVEHLIERNWSDFFESGEVMAYVDGWAVASAAKLPQLHERLGLPGEYGIAEAMAALKARGVGLPRQVTIWDAWAGRDRAVWMPFDFKQMFSDYFAERDPATFFSPATSGARRMIDHRTEIFDQWAEERFLPWREGFERALGDEARFLAEQGIAWRATQVAQWEMIRRLSPEQQEELRQWAQLAALSPEEQEQLRQWVQEQEWLAIAALSPEEQEQLRQWAAIAALSPEEQEELRQLAIDNAFETQLERIEARRAWPGSRVLLLAGIGAAVGLGVYLSRDG